MNLPKEITKHILRIERDILFHKSLNEWIYLDSESRKYKFKRFFYDENHHLFINEISDINGSFSKLNDYKQRIKEILQSNKRYILRGEV